MRYLILVAVMCVGCAPATASQSESAGAAGAPAYLLEGPAYDDEVVVDAYVADSGVEVEGVDVDLHALYFGDSGWDCCYTSECETLREYFCDADEVPATDGLHTCCVPNAGQCPDVDVDAGVE